MAIKKREFGDFEIVKVVRMDTWLLGKQAAASPGKFKIELSRLLCLECSASAMSFLRITDNLL